MPLTLVSTPIGNLDDLTPRAAEALREADFWIVEDTRISGKLRSVVGAQKPMKVLNDHTSDSGVLKLLKSLKDGESACLISDGGTPAISDPGAILTDRCHDSGVEVDVAPGPSAVTAALAISGFFAQRFAFLGFLPRKDSAIRENLQPFLNSSLTLVIFESMNRIEPLLRIAGETLGPRRYAICRELTKLHQQVFRENLPTIPSETQVPRKGETTIVIEGLRKSGHTSKLAGKMSVQGEGPGQG